MKTSDVLWPLLGSAALTTLTTRIFGARGGDGGKGQQWSSPPEMTIDPAKQYTATLRTSEGDLTIALLPDEAPATVNNFVFLARQGFYNGVIFHRIMKGFMVQTGDPTGTGSGGPGYKFKDEPVRLPYSKGIVAMANAGPNTNGSQFFIVHGEQAPLPPSYTVFGRVTGGLDTLDKIANTPVALARGERSKPTREVRIDSVDVDEA